MSRESTTQQRQIWLIFFFLGIIMLNFPFMQIFNRPETIFCLPLMVLYLLVGWPLSIVVIYIFSRSLESNDDDEAVEPPEQEDN
ncbi:MAG: hypothetical protein J7K75_10040 [Desulfuromonas sp.]|nr:hypothetical protein [Desulfuromonas sp.]